VAVESFGVAEVWVELVTAGFWPAGAAAGTVAVGAAAAICTV
jgi:hypothetical protein